MNINYTNKSSSYKPLYRPISQPNKVFKPIQAIESRLIINNPTSDQKQKIRNSQLIKSKYNFSPSQKYQRGSHYQLSQSKNNQYSKQFLQLNPQSKFSNKLQQKKAENISKNKTYPLNNPTKYNMYSMLDQPYQRIMQNGCSAFTCPAVQCIARDQFSRPWKY